MADEPGALSNSRIWPYYSNLLRGPSLSVIPNKPLRSTTLSIHSQKPFFKLLIISLQRRSSCSSLIPITSCLLRFNISHHTMDLDLLLHKMDTTLTFKRAPHKSYRMERAKNQEEDWRFPLAAKTLVPTHRPISDIAAALKFHWVNHRPRDIIPVKEHYYLIKFNHEQDLRFVLNECPWAVRKSVLNEGPWAVFGQLLLLHRFKLGMKVNELPFDSFRIWFRMENLPYLLQDFLVINAIRPRNNQGIPLEGHQQQTTLSVLKHIPSGIHIDKSETSTFVSFAFMRLPPQFCQRCRKLGHREVVCEDDLNIQDDVLVMPAIAPPSALAMQNQVREGPRLSQSLTTPNETCGSSPHRLPSPHRTHQLSPSLPMITLHNKPIQNMTLL